VFHRDVLRYRRGRYLWWGLGLVAASILLYATSGRAVPAAGDTWQGYTLGTLGALLIVWLTWLGIRKRRYASTTGSLEGWASAHVYLGLALIVVATLHTAFQIGWNIHTLAFVLMLLVIGSGIVGLYFYLSFPRRASDNRRAATRAELFAELFELDVQGRELARRCDPVVAASVVAGIERTVVGGGWLTQLTAGDRSRFLAGGAGGGEAKFVPNVDQQPLVDFVADRVPRAEKRQEAENLQALLSALCRRQAILRRIRRDIQLQGLLQGWLYVHVPLTIALLAALVAHILSTYIYW